MGHFKAMGRAECCDECGETPCAPCGPVVCEALLECQTRSASGSKEGPPACARPSFDGDGRYWLTATFVKSESSSGSYNCTTDPEEGYGGGSYSVTYSDTDNKTTVTTCDEETGELTCTASGSFSRWAEVTSQYDGGDTETLRKSASGSYSSCDQSSAEAPEEGDDFSFNIVWGNEADCPASWGGDYSPPRTPTSATSATFHESESCSKAQDQCSGGGHRSSNYSKTDTETLSDEWLPETTGDLISRVTGDLGSWANGACVAARHLSEDESSFSITEGRIRVTHPRSSTGQIRVTIQVETTPDGGETTTDTMTYTWTGSPEGEDIVGDWMDLPTPTDNATVEATIIEVTCNP